jgi:hypothetical protein
MCRLTFPFDWFSLYVVWGRLCACCQLFATGCAAGQAGLLALTEWMEYELTLGVPLLLLLLIR